MRHYVLTRSAYGPEWSIEANRRRLAITRGVTAKLMAQQTHRDWTWIVLLDPRDPLLEERMNVFEEGAPRFVPLIWQPTNPTGAPWDPHRVTATTVQKVAATAYRAPWPVDHSGLTLQTRLDDDDGFAPDALERTVRKVMKMRLILMQPIGFRVWDGRCSRVRHETNAMHTLVTPPGDTLGVYDYGHRLVKRVAPVIRVDQEPAWLWVRHRDTISGIRQADRPITKHIRTLFPIDWSSVG